MNLQQMPRGWGKSHFVDSIRLAEAAKSEPQIWVNSRGQIVLDVYLEWDTHSLWDTHGLWVRVDVKMKREGDNGFVFQRVADHPQPGALHRSERARALRAYGDMEAIKLGMPWRPRGRL